MQGVMETGTGSAAKVPGIVVCGKTGTVENYYKGVKQKSHAFFAAFAPRENPRIAIAVICENAGMGANSSAPIASLMIEQYLRDSIPEPDRKAKIETLANLNLMPARIFEAIRIRDSLREAKNNSHNIEKGLVKNAKDTSGIEEEEDDSDIIYKSKSSDQQNDLNTDTTHPKKNNKVLEHKPEATLPERKKRPDTLNIKK